MIVQLDRRAWRAGRPPMLKAFAAIYRTSLRRLERNSGLFPALRAHRFRLYPLDASRTRFIPLCTICFAGLATLGLVLKTLVREKHLLAGSEDEFCSAIGALQDLVMVFHTLLRGPGSLGADSNGTVRSRRSNKSPHVIADSIRPPARSCLERLRCCDCLVLLTPLLLTETLTREGLLCATLFPRLHVVAVLLDFLDDVFRLHLPFEAPESVFQRLTLLNYNFCHAYSPPSLFLDLDFLDSSKCNRHQREPAIGYFFYRRLSSKSRLKLLIKAARSVFNALVNNSFGPAPKARFVAGFGGPERQDCGTNNMLLE
jgi:hypothetical protein